MKNKIKYKEMIKNKNLMEFDEDGNTGHDRTNIETDKSDD